MPASWKWLPEVVSQPAVELVEVIAVAMKCVRVSRKTTQIPRKVTISIPRINNERRDNYSLQQNENHNKERGLIVVGHPTIGG